MELGAVINELNEHVSIMDAYNYNVSIAVGHNISDNGCNQPKLQRVADANQRLGARTNAVNNKRRSLFYDDPFVQPPPPLFIEPVLTSPDDYVHLSSLPKRAKLDEYYVRSTVPGIVRNTLLNKPHNVVVSDPLNALGDADDSISLMKINLYGPDIRQPTRADDQSPVSNEPTPPLPPAPPPLPPAPPPPPPLVPDFESAIKSPTLPVAVADNSSDGRNSRDKFLDSIRLGVKLRPVRDRKLAPLDPRQQDRASVMPHVLLRRRKAIDPTETFNRGMKIMGIVNDTTESVAEDALFDEFKDD